MRNLVKTLLIPIALILTVNAVSAVSPAVREAINGLPVADQINFIADELDKVKREQACQRAEIEKQMAFDASGIMDKNTISRDIEARKSDVLALGETWRVNAFLPHYDSYLKERIICSPIP